MRLTATACLSAIALMAATAPAYAPAGVNKLIGILKAGAHAGETRPQLHYPTMSDEEVLARANSGDATALREVEHRKFEARRRHAENANDAVNLFDDADRVCSRAARVCTVRGEGDLRTYDCKAPGDDELTVLSPKLCAIWAPNP